MEEQDYILFESYLSNKLSNEAIVDFETRLKTDSDFNQAFKTYKVLTSFLEHKFKNEEATIAFKENLNKISESHFNNDKTVTETKSPAKSFTFYKYAVAACVVALVGLFVFNQFSTPVYGDFANYDQISLTVRGETNALLKTAENAFNNKDFAKAEETFKSLLKTDSENTELQLYSAIANIELNDYVTAESLLMNLKNGESVYKNKATWYLALSKLKQGQNQECVKILKTIPEDAEAYKQAQKLIKRLD